MAKLFGNKTQLTVKELKPTDANQKNSKEYVAKLHEILSFKEKYNSKVADAQAKVTDLKQQIQKVDAAIIMEIDEDTNRELIDKRKSIKNELEVYEAVVNSDVGEIIKAKYDALRADNNELYTQAVNEYHAFLNEVDREIELIQEQVQTAVDELRELRNQHIGFQVQGLSESIVYSTRK